MATSASLNRPVDELAPALGGTSSATTSSLYVHVPFCAHKCEYCAFYSHAPGGDVVDRYVRALITELAHLERPQKVRTIFFGGGTPSLLTLKQWESVLTA